MASLRIMKSTVGAVRIISSRMAHSSTSSTMNHPQTAGVDLDKFDPNNYSVPLRTVTMNDCVEPYGPWRTAYKAEKNAATWAIIKGILCLSASLTFLFNCGALDGLDMPNLDNIMEETEPYNFDTFGRISVVRDD